MSSAPYGSFYEGQGKQYPFSRMMELSCDTSPIYALCILSRGITFVPISSMDFMSWVCVNPALSIWKVKRDIPPRASLCRNSFSATCSGPPTTSTPRGAIRVSKCLWLPAASPVPGPALSRIRHNPGNNPPLPAHSSAPHNPVNANQLSVDRA